MANKRWLSAHEIAFKGKIGTLIEGVPTVFDENGMVYVTLYDERGKFLTTSGVIDNPMQLDKQLFIDTLLFYGVPVVIDAKMFVYPDYDIITDRKRTPLEYSITKEEITTVKSRVAAEIIKALASVVVTSMNDREKVYENRLLSVDIVFGYDQPFNKETGEHDVSEFSNRPACMIHAAIMGALICDVESWRKMKNMLDGHIQEWAQHKVTAWIMAVISQSDKPVKPIDLKLIHQ